MEYYEDLKICKNFKKYDKYKIYDIYIYIYIYIYNKM